MSTLDTLHEAFAELERRAEAMAARSTTTAPGEPAEMVAVSSGDRPARFTRRGPLLAAAAVAVAAVTIPTTLLLGGHDGHHHATAPGGRVLPTVSARVTPPPAVSPSTPAPAHSTAPAKADIPATPAELAHRLREALAGSATFTYSALVPHEPVIGGVLTDSATGRRGGFDLQIDAGSPGDKASCEDAETSHCVISTLPDGSSLSVGHEPLGSGAEVYLVNLVQPNGVTLLMHVSNQTDPKGSGAILGTKPPLSIKRIVTVLRSKVW